MRPVGATGIQPGAERSDTPGYNACGSVALKGQKHGIVKSQNHCNALLHSGWHQGFCPFRAACCQCRRYPGCRYALPRAVCSLPFQGAKHESFVEFTLNYRQADTVDFLVDIERVNVGHAAYIIYYSHDARCQVRRVYVVLAAHTAYNLA